MSVVDKMRDSLDPQTVANGLYEVILNWRRCDLHIQRIELKPKAQIGDPVLATLCGQRKAYEKTISVFVGYPDGRIRSLLREHFREATPK